MYINRHTRGAAAGWHLRRSLGSRFFFKKNMNRLRARVPFWAYTPTPSDQFPVHTRI